MKIYFDKDESYTICPQSTPTIRDKEGIDVPDQIWKTYEGIEKAYFNMLDYFEELFVNQK